MAEMKVFEDMENPGRYVDENGMDITEAYTMNPLKAAAYGVGNIAHNIAERVIPRSVAEATGLGMPLSRENRQTMEDIEGANPFSFGAGEFGAQLIGPTKGGPLLQGAYGALQGALTADQGEAQTGFLLGGAGGFGGDIVGRILGRAKNALTSIGREQVDPVAQELLDSGYKLTPAEKSGKQGYMKIERQFEKTNAGQDIVGEMGEANEQLLISRANEAVGLPANHGPLNRGAREIAHNGVVDKMARAGEGVTMDIPQDTASRISEIVRRDEWMEIPEIPAGGTVSGRDYMTIRKELSRAQRSTDPGSTAEAYIQRTMDSMDNAFMEAAGPERAALYRAAREHEKNLITLERGKALSTTGEVNPNSAATAFGSNYGKRSVDNALPETRNLIRDMDNLSSPAVNPRIGDSGTADASLRSLTNWQDWVQSMGAEKYYSGELSMPGLLEKAGPAAAPLGANIGRAGLLSLEN